LAVAVAFSGIRYADGAQAAKQEPAAATALKIESTKEKPAPPLPNFAKVYGLAFETLQNAGARLTDARLKSDPIALALIAIELGVGEKVSGKKAEVTAEEIQKEAVDLAVLRRQAPELSAMTHLVKDEAVAKKLSDLAKKAEQEEADRVARFKSGERDKGIHVLEVRNTTPVQVSVRINGVHLGWVPGNGQSIFNTSQFYEPPQIFLSAHDQFGDVFRSEYHTGHHHYFVWTLTDSN
jgi:hypothetical protein